MQPVEEPHDPEHPGQVIDPKVIAERRARRAEINEGAMRDRAREAERALELARAQLQGAHEQRAELAARLKQVERDLRAARQGEHAESARRTEVEEELAVARREADEEATALRLALAAEEQRVTELEEDLERALRTSTAAQAASRDALASAVAELTGEGGRSAELADAEAVLAARLAELQAVEDRLAAARTELDARRGGLEERLADTSELIAGLEDALAAERAARARAVQALEDERERAAAEVTLLQHELDRRAEIHEAVAGQLAELRGELSSARARAEGTSVGSPALEELAATAAALREDLAVLHVERGELEHQLAAARADVAERDERLQRSEEALAHTEAELARLRASIQAATSDLPGTGTDAARNRVRLQVAEDAVIAAEERAREIGARLEAEQRERARAEAQLQLQLAAERDALQERIAEHRLELEAVVARERASFETQMAAVREGVAGVRERLIRTETEIDARIGVERAARTAAEAQVQVEREGRESLEVRLEAERAAYANERERRILEARELQSRLAAAQDELTEAQAALAAEHGRIEAAIAESGARAEAALAGAVAAEERARRAEAERDRLIDALTAARAELDTRSVVEGDFRASLASLRAELEQVRVDAKARVPREAQLEALLGELLSTTTSLREGFERELLALAAAREEDRAAMTRAAEQALEAERGRFAGEIGEMESRVSELRAQLGAAATELAGEFAQEQAARQALESELARARAGGPGAEGDDAPAPEPAAGEPTGEDIARLRADLTREEAASARAEDRIVELEDELERVRTTLRPPPPMPPADHPALTGRGAAGSEGEVDDGDIDPGASSGDPDSVIIDLARAAARLRAPKGEAAEAEDPAEADGPADADADADLVPAPAPALPLTEVELGARVPAASTRRVAGGLWLTPALLVLSRRDHAAAAELFKALVTVQADRLRKDLTYDLAIGELPEQRVSLHADGTATVELLGEDEPPAGADFRLSGTLEALAPYAGGGTGRRAPDGVTVSGRRRRARKLLKALRDPVGLHAIAELPEPLEPQALLALVAGAIDPALTRGKRFSVAFAEGDGPFVAHVVVDDGVPLVVRSGEPVDTAATVRTAPGELARFLAGEAGARVGGDVELVVLLLGWADIAQGLDG
ncbi:hypothetical protein NBH00_13120 [Paraconexibacter antarcticus]|uniref:Chromosome segregation ATPase n=1 Tax=Paraconexibacter antarcticus TaxID=2949664 RepID=A0ABY5DKQ3_9ACTN|nr:hypothetical protein [Paraconexibacter antarcticus]UTI62303.1 hypothetical protein NBH00_13120 [Paraconexibacter antarcticus]